MSQKIVHDAGRSTKSIEERPTPTERESSSSRTATPRAPQHVLPERQIPGADPDK
jgi:hypothetical protein